MTEALCSRSQMLRIMALLPLASPTRTLADGSSGTLGRESVGEYELRDGAVTRRKLADLSPGTLLGRLSDGGPGEVQEVEAEALAHLVGATVEVGGLAAAADAPTVRLPDAALALRTFGYYAPGDGGSALYRRASAEPAHPGKLSTANGIWWELVVEGTVTPKQFGAVGDGAVNDTAAFNAALAFCKAKGAPLYIPEGAYVLSALDPMIDDISGGPAVSKQQLAIRGAGRDLTRLIYSGDLSGPLFDFSPSPTVKQGSVDISDLSILGKYRRGPAIRFNHMLKSSLTRVRIAEVLDVGIDCKELWDSTFIDVLITHTGDPDAKLPSVRLANRDPAAHNSSCNNLGFYDLHVEAHPYRALEILDTSRKLTFVRLKCHHDPGNFPSLGTDHVVLDARAAPAGGGYQVSFLGVHLAVSSGSGIVLDNTGGTAAGGFFGVQITGGSIQSQAEYGVKLLNCAGVTVSAMSMRNNGDAALLLHEACANVQIDWDTVTVEQGVPVRYDGTGWTNGESQAAEIRAGSITAAGGAMRIDSQGLNGPGNLEAINGGGYGASLAVGCWTAARPVTVRQTPGGNILTAGGVDRVLDHEQSILTLRYDERRRVWVETTFTQVID